MYDCGLKLGSKSYTIAVGFDIGMRFRWSHLQVSVFSNSISQSRNVWVSHQLDVVSVSL